MPVAVVTGAASGFGLARSRQSARLGMDVALLDRDGERASTAAEQVAEEHGVRSIGVATDVGDAASVEAATAVVASELGGTDLLISNVGVQLFGALEAFTDDEWRWLLDTNVIGSARVVRSFLPLLRASAAPRLAFTTSSSILDPAARLGAYQASKFALWGLAETLRVELADDGIGITVIFPSGMVTRHLETSEDAQPDHLKRPIAHDGDFDAMIESNPAMASMLATPEDAATGVVGAIMAGAPYIVTHGDLRAAVAGRNHQLSAAADRARDP